jgi:IclR family acetate operon transcriptional repressor
MSDPVATEERYTVRSVVRALGILDELATAPREGRSVTDLAEACGLSKSATFALLHTLISVNFVADSGAGQNRRYRLGRALTRLGDIARAQVSLPDAARPTLQRLAAELRVSVRLGVLEGNRVSMVDRVDAQGGLRIDLGMGNQELLHCTAVGKALLAARPDEEVVSLLGDGPLLRKTAHTLASLQDVVSNLRVIRTRGYSIDDEEDFEGVLCIGAPVHDSGGGATAAISVTMLKAQTPPERIEQVGGTLLAAAREISVRLGYVAKTAPEPTVATTAQAVA